MARLTYNSEEDTEVSVYRIGNDLVVAPDPRILLGMQALTSEQLAAAILHLSRGDLTMHEDWRAEDLAPTVFEIPPHCRSSA